MTQVVLATSNIGKAAELQQSLQEFGLEVLPQSQFDVPEAIENGLTFVENALIKARNACKHTNLPAIADDSGIEVDALNGAPGIYSARYAGGSNDQDNNDKLLSELSNVSNRRARFVCLMVYMQHQNDPTPIICEGYWEGEIAHVSRGVNGFGYDPLFYVPELDCHSAELTAQQKKQYSHRAKALNVLKYRLNK